MSTSVSPSRSLPMVAIPKGALFDGTLDALTEAGYSTANARADDRRQLFADDRLMTMRPSDVVTYVAEGAAELGIVGKDVIVESPMSANVYELLDLRFGSCRMVLATVNDDVDPVRAAMSRLGVARIGTKYPRATMAWAERTGRSVDIVELKGSVELAAVVRLADGIVDLVQTGRTLVANGLVEREAIFGSSARLIANPVAYARAASAVDRLAEALEGWVSTAE